MKECKSCGVNKNESDFYPTISKQKIYLSSDCKECRKKRVGQYAKTHIELNREKSLRSYYKRKSNQA